MRRVCVGSNLARLATLSILVQSTSRQGRLVRSQVTFDRVLITQDRLGYTTTLCHVLARAGVDMTRPRHRQCMYNRQAAGSTSSRTPQWITSTTPTRTGGCLRILWMYHRTSAHAVHGTMREARDTTAVHWHMLVYDLVLTYARNTCGAHAWCVLKPSVSNAEGRLGPHGVDGCGEADAHVGLRPARCLRVRRRRRWDWVLICYIQSLHA